MNNNKIQIPTNIIRKYIEEELLNRRDGLMEKAKHETYSDLKEFGLVTEYASEIGWNSAGVGVLADEVKDGTMSIKEALGLLTKPEKKLFMINVNNGMKIIRKKKDKSYFVLKIKICDLIRVIWKINQNSSKKANKIHEFLGW